MKPRKICDADGSDTYNQGHDCKIRKSGPRKFRACAFSFLLHGNASGCNMYFLDGCLDGTYTSSYMLPYPLVTVNSVPASRSRLSILSPLFPTQVDLHRRREKNAENEQTWELFFLLKTTTTCNAVPARPLDPCRRRKKDPPPTPSKKTINAF